MSPGMLRRDISRRFSIIIIIIITTTEIQQLAHGHAPGHACHLESRQINLVLASNF